MLPDSSPMVSNEPAFEELALQDTQEDEYYQDIMPEGWLNSLNELKRNPYPGLRPFKTSEASVFFGRKMITQELIIRLAKHRFLAILGSSGTGKSSLVRAGLLPSLKILPGKHGLWKVAICRPGKNPFGNLAKAMSKGNIAPELSEYAIWKAISASSFGFEEFYATHNLNKEFNTLIIVDQFEELFRYRKDSISGKNDSSLFVKMLIEVSKLENLNTYVLITMRSEYLGDCVQFPVLVDEINDAQFLVPRLKEFQLREAIVAPTAFTNAHVDPMFADRLLGEVGDNMDQLPVLQHSLRRTFEVAKSHHDATKGINLTYEDYNKVGRMEHAINDHADEIFDRFDNIEKKFCEILFKCITDKATDGRGVRRPLPFHKILKICAEDQNVSSIPADQQRKYLTKIINAYRADKVNFLMPPLIGQMSEASEDTIRIEEDTEIDISHESIMRIWKHLIQWVEKEAKDADLLRQLLNRDTTNYLAGTNLSIYKDFLLVKEHATTWASLYMHKEENAEKRFDDAIQLIKNSIQQELVRETEKLELLEAKRRENEERLKREHEEKERKLQQELEIETRERQAQEILAKSAKKLAKSARTLRFLFWLMAGLSVVLLILLFRINSNRISNKLNTVNDWMEKEDYAQARKILNYEAATTGMMKYLNFLRLDSLQTLHKRITSDSSRKNQFSDLVKGIDTLRGTRLGDSLYRAFELFTQASAIAFTKSQTSHLNILKGQLKSDVTYSFNRYVNKAEALYSVNELSEARKAFAIALTFAEDSVSRSLLDKNSPDYMKFLELRTQIK